MNSCKYVFILVLLGLIISCAPKQTEPVPPISSKEKETLKHRSLVLKWVPEG